MSNKRKVLPLAVGEEVYITNPGCDYALKIRSTLGKLSARKLNQIYDSPNVWLNYLSFEQLKRYIILEEFYQLLSSVDVPEDIRVKVNEVLKYHEELVFGKSDTDH